MHRQFITMPRFPSSLCEPSSKSLLWFRCNCKRLRLPLFDSCCRCLHHRGQYHFLPLYILLAHRSRSSNSVRSVASGTWSSAGVLPEDAVSFLFRWHFHLASVARWVSVNGFKHSSQSCIPGHGPSLGGAPGQNPRVAIKYEDARPGIKLVQRCTRGCRCFGPRHGKLPLLRPHDENIQSCF